MYVHTGFRVHSAAMVTRVLSGSQRLVPDDQEPESSLCILTFQIPNDMAVMQAKEVFAEIAVASPKRSQSSKGQPIIIHKVHVRVHPGLEVVWNRDNGQRFVEIGTLHGAHHEHLARTGHSLTLIISS
jgi:hypothetical protein